MECADAEGYVEGAIELTPPPHDSLRVDTPAEAGGESDTVPSATVHQKEPAAAIAAPKIDFAHQLETLAKTALLAIPGNAVESPRVVPTDLGGAQSGGENVVGPATSHPLGEAALPEPSEMKKVEGPRLNTGLEGTQPVVADVVEPATSPAAEDSVFPESSAKKAKRDGALPSPHQMTIVSPVLLEDEERTQAVATLVDPCTTITDDEGPEPPEEAEVPSGNASLTTTGVPVGVKAPNPRMVGENRAGPAGSPSGGTTAAEVQTAPEVIDKPPARRKITDLSLPDTTELIMPGIDFIRVTQTGNCFWDHVWVIKGEHWRSCPVVLAKGSEDHLNVLSRDTTVLRRVTQCRGDVCKKEDDPNLILALKRINQDDISCCKRLGTIDPAVILPAMLEA